jgi:cobalt-zinc-cadmium efflux system membrane fusion protein
MQLVRSFLMRRSALRPPAPRIGARVSRHSLAVSALLLAALLPAVVNFASAQAPQPTSQKGNTVRITADQMHQLEIAKVESTVFRAEKQAIGQIAFNEDASTLVLTPFSGRVTRLIAKIGDAVKRGDPLFEIDSPEVVQAQTDLIAAVQGRDKSKSQLALAKRTFDRQTGLFAAKATSQRELEQANTDHTAAETDVRTAEGVLNAARNRLRVLGRSDLEVARLEEERLINPLIAITSPLDGTVIARKVGPGQYVRSDSGEPLYSIADLSMMWLKANVPENDIAFVRTGQEIEVRVLAVPDRVFKARIGAIGAASDATTRRVVVRSEIANPDGALKSEMFATFKIVTGNGEPEAAVPVEAVVRDGDLAFAWVERGPTLLERRKVKLGIEQNGRLQIREGLQPGERVVVRGAIFVDNEWRQ